MSRKAVEHRWQNWLFQAVGNARDRLLLADYEGTLAPTSTGHGCRLPLAGVSDRLQYITTHCNTHLITISGRPAHEIRAALGICPAPEIWGGDGLERLYSDGRYECRELDVPNDALEALGESEVVLRRHGLGRFIQVGLAGISVQWNGLSDIDEILDVRTTVCHTFRPLGAKYASLRFMEFEGGAELRLRGATRGEALRRLLSGTSAETPVAYIANDRTDKDACEIIDGRELTVLVRLVLDSTVGRALLRPQHELIRFLDEWIRACQGNA